MTLDDLEWPKRTFAEKNRFTESTRKISTTTDPYYQRQNVGRSLILLSLSVNIRYMRIFARIPQGGGSKDSGVVEYGNFDHFNWLFVWKL